MGVLNVNTFGGTLLGVTKRDLPDGYAQQAVNMHARVNTFEPLHDDLTPITLVDGNLTPLAAGVTVRTIFRYPFRSTDTTNLMGSPLEVSVVKGQILSDKFERCYLSDDTPPKTGVTTTNIQPYVLYQPPGGAPTIRPMGVPAPTTEMTYAQTSVAQLTSSTLASLQTANEALILQKFGERLKQTWEGPVSSISTPGYLDCTAADDASATGYTMTGTAPQRARIFGVNGTGWLTFSNLGAEHFTWAVGPEYTVHTFNASQVAAVNAWGKPGTAIVGQQFCAVPFRSSYPVYTMDNASAPAIAAKAAILAIRQPGRTAGDRILTSTQLDELDAQLMTLAGSSNPPIAAIIGRIKFRREVLTQLMEGTIGQAALDRLAVFLSSTEVQNAITAAYDAFGSAVWDKMYAAYLTPANASATYTGASYPITSGTDIFTATKATSVSYIIAAAKVMLTGDGAIPLSGVSTAAVAPYVAVRSFARIQNFLNAQKITIYNAAPVAQQDAVAQACLALDFSAELYALYTATTIETLGLHADAPAIFASGGEATADAVIGARELLHLELDNLTAYYQYVVAQIRATIKAYLQITGSNDLHAEIDPLGKQIFQTRFYTHTYVNDWEEESQDWAHANPAGAMPTSLDVDQNDSVTLTLTGTVPSGYGITKWRVYRSNSASDTKYQLVKEAPIGTTTIVDDLLAAELQETLATDIWSFPPTEVVNGVTTNLQGFVNMPNNFMAAFINNTVYFSEISAYYAWPPDYTITMAFPIVGMEVFGQTLVVLTKGGVYYVTGADPSAMSKTDPESNQACLSKQSIAKVMGGVVFASPNGLCVASGSGVQLFLPSPLGKTYWAPFKPELMRCVEYNGVLYVSGGIYRDDIMTGKWQVVVGINLATMKMTSVDSFGGATTPGITAWFVDRTTDALWAALPHNGGVPKATQMLAASTFRAATWRSKRITLPAEDGFAWLQVMGEQTATAGYGAAIKLYGYLTNPLTALEVETVLVNQTLTNINPVRVASGRFLEFEVEVTSKAQINHILFAGSVEELQAIT